MVCLTHGMVLVLALSTAFTGCRPRTSSASSPGTIVNPLPPEAATNHAQRVEEIRQLAQRTKWERRTFKNASSGSELQYVLFKPAAGDSKTNLPLVLSLHGGSVREDFSNLLEPVKGLPFGLGRLVSEETQQRHPSFVVAPWSNNENWDEGNLRVVLEMLDSLQREFRIDTNRIYVTGQSMGGFGTWRIITKHPGKFAAAIPICGGGISGDAPRAKNVPIWAFHGTADKSVPVSYTREMISAIRDAGGNPRYWEYLGESHAGTAARAYCEPELIDWLFSQSR